MVDLKPRHRKAIDYHLDNIFEFYGKYNFNLKTQILIIELSYEADVFSLNNIIAEVEELGFKLFATNSIISHKSIDSMSVSSSKLLCLFRLAEYSIG